MRSIPALPEDVSLRLWPETWLGPLNLDSEWEQTGPRVLDVGCGKGRFLLAHAERHPNLRLLGIERKLRRVRKIDRKAVRRGLRNIRLLRIEADYAMRYLIPANWIDICYLFFPDPWPKEKHHGNRLMSRNFLDRLEHTLSAEGVVHFATDHAPYFDEVVEILEADPRWRPVEPYRPREEEVSDFELMHRERKPIHRRSFARKVPPPLHGSDSAS